MSDVNGVKQTRKEKAAATRRRIIAAAAEEFVHSGYHGTAMTAIANRAGYAVQTVYFVFHTKAELFAAALDTAVLGPEGKPPLDQDWARDAVGDVSDPTATTPPAAGRSPHGPSHSLWHWAILQSAGTRS